MQKQSLMQMKSHNMNPELKLKSTFSLDWSFATLSNHLLKSSSESENTVFGKYKHTKALQID